MAPTERDNSRTPNSVKKQTTDTSCPDTLLKNGNMYFLYNSKLPIVNGTNPIVFNSLDEYISYNKKSPNSCPLLYLASETTTQGEEVYRVRPSPFNNDGGVQTFPTANFQFASQPVIQSGTGPQSTLSSSPEPQSTLSSSPGLLPQFDADMYAGFDALNQGVGAYTELDKIHDQTQNQPISDNPMDPNWGGREYTRKLVDSGKYDDYNISRPMLFNPKNVMFNPELAKSYGIEPPKDVY